MDRPARKPRVLFLCTANACRNQMAEGWLRHLAGDRLEALSAGSTSVGRGSEHGAGVAGSCGETLSSSYPQAWFRDKNPAGTSNFTDAVDLTF